MAGMTDDQRPIDPVAEPDAYRNELLRWLGADDPADVQAATVAHMRAAVERAGARLRDRPAPTEWSVIECLGHLLDSEIVTSARVRWIIAEDTPDIVGYDQELWVAALEHRDDAPDELIARFDALRGANLQLWGRLGATMAERFGVHRERGPESYGLLTRLQAGHDRFHLAQADRALAALVGGNEPAT